MKILQVIPYFVPAWDRGGPLNAAYHMSKELVKSGHEVTVYTTNVLNRNSKIKEMSSIIDGIKVKRFTNLSNFLAYNQNIFLSPGMIFEVKKSLKNFDVIHMHEYRTMQNVIARHYALKYGIPYVLQAHGSLPIIMGKTELKKFYDNIWGQKILQDAAYVIAVTNVEAEQFKMLGIKENKIKVIPNGIDLAEYVNLPPKGNFKRKHGLTENQEIILYLGRIHKIKGLDLLVRAFNIVKKSDKQVKLVITGPDNGYLAELMSTIRDLGIEDHVIITGPLYGQDKIEAYVDADVYVLPSIYETCPISVIEACACGTPVIVTDRCGIANIIDNQAGIVVPYDEIILSKTLLTLLHDNNKKQEFGKNGILLVRDKLNWDKINKQIEDIYVSCVTSKHAKSGNSDENQST